MRKLTDKEYAILDRYIAAVLKRHRTDISGAAEAHEDLMHPLTAAFDGNSQEFIPYMELMLSKWEGGDE